jgi:OmpA-OmpF porin, OOP family
MNWLFKFILLPLLISTKVFSNVLGDMQTFVPNTDGLDFITVHTSRPMYSDYLVLSQYLNFAKDHLLVYRNVATQEKMSYANELAEYDFSIGYGFTKNFSAYLQAPFLWYYQSETKDSIKINIDKGIHSIRPGFKYSFGDADIPSWAILGSIDIPSLVDSPYTGVKPATIVNLEGVYTYRNEKAVHGVNTGIRFRSPSDRPTDQRMFPLDDQLLLSYAYSNEFTETSRWVFETIYSYPLEKKPYENAQDASSLDLLLGLKHRWWKNTNFDWGATIEPGIETLAPAWRVFAGIVWYWKPHSEEPKGPPPTAKKAAPTRASPTGFRVTPEESTVVVGEQVSFEFFGGKAPYQCEILSGDGQFIGKYCDFLSPENPGSSEIEFKDSLGQTTNALVNYKAPSEFAGELGIRPSRAEIFEGQTIQFRAVGGKAPFRFGVIDGSGTINNNGLFKGPLEAQNVMIEVVDSVGRSATASIQVKEIPKPDKLIRLKNLKFDFDKDTLTKDSRKEMEQIISTLFELNIKSLIIEGHTDSMGKDEYNQNLSERRAKAIKNILLDNLDIRDNQITAIGFGEARPIATNKTDAGRAQNRRVDMKVYIKK